MYDWDQTGDLPEKIEGKRIVLFDELATDSDFNYEVQEFLDEWAIVLLVNGVKEGAWYNNKLYKQKELKPGC